MLRSLASLIAFAISISTVQPKAVSADQAARAGLVVVELFTSQGCSSCPPADKLLTEIHRIGSAGNLPVYCLSFHVDYWNSLGWDDPYSSQSSTKRQHRYAAALHSQRVYTPQMIVNGQVEFVGSRGAEAKQAIESALATPATTSVKLTATKPDDPRTIGVDYQVSGHSPGTVLHVVLVQAAAKNNVSRGENRGRELAHVQVVRSLRTVPLRKSAGQLQLSLPSGLEPRDARIVAFVQDPSTMRISGASSIGF